MSTALSTRPQPQPRRRVLLLALLLLAQLALAAGLLWRQAQLVRDRPGEPLLAATAEADTLLVADGSGNRARLERRDGAWRLPALHDLPADADKVSAVLNSLAAQRTRWPVATTGGSQARFEVAPDQFQRHVQVLRGETVLADVFLGSSPAFRQVHVRRAAEDDIFSVDLTVHDLPSASAGWLQQSLLAVSEPRSIAGADYALAKTGDGDWMLEAGDAADGGRTLNQERAAGLAAALAGLRVQGVAPEGALPAGATPLELRVGTQDGDFRYRFHAEGEQHYVQRDDRDLWFTTARFDYDRLAAVARADLLQEPDAVDAEPALSGDQVPAAAPANDAAAPAGASQSGGAPTATESPPDHAH